MPPSRRYGKGQFFMTFPSKGLSIGDIPIHALLKDTVDDISDRLYRAATRIAPKETGELRAKGIRKFSTRRVNKNTWRGGIGLARTPEHGIFVHEGTGIYGPRKSPITPRKSPYLKFTIGDRTFRLRSVRGQKAQPFIDKAFILVNRTYVPLRVERLKRLIQLFANN